jgi:hypothetical protein
MRDGRDRERGDGGRRGRPSVRVVMNRLNLTFAVVTLTGCGGHIVVGAADGDTVPVTSVVPGSSDDGGDDGGTGIGTGTGTGSGGPFPICPGTQPTPGTTCSTPDRGCAYVNQAKGTCVSFTCSESSGTWVTSTPAGC